MKPVDAPSAWSSPSDLDKKESDTGKNPDITDPSKPNILIVISVFVDESELRIWLLY